MKKIDLKKLLQKDKKSLTLMAIAVATLLLLVIGATYAYFAANIGNGTNASINASTATTDSLSFSVGKDIEIHANMENFRPGMEDLHGETTATATLKANSYTNNATARYNVFFIIDNNNFEYTTEDAQTELLLKVTDPNGNEVMDITGLKRVEGGFDITTRTGGFLIMADYDIAATTAEVLKSQTWKLEITYINLEANQNKNKGKALNGRFYITTEKESTYEPVKINSIETSSSSNSITANLTLAGTKDIKKYYYAIEEVTSGVAYLGAGVSVARLSNELAVVDTDYIESDEPTHTFTNLKPNTKYKVYSYAIDQNGVKSNIYSTEVTTGDYSIPIIESVTISSTASSITVNVNSKKGSEEISKYYYSIDDGSLIESNSTTHTFSGLAANTSHTIRIKAVDTNGIESEIYTLTATTFNVASITNITTSVTSSSITINVTATKGDADIASYYYSKDNGVTWSEATTNSSYTFNNLNSNTTYQIKVKVVDTEGRESSEAVATAKTSYVLASITNVTHSTTLNSITVNVTATAGSNPIVKYYYSKDNGSTYVESNNSSYTFSGLLDTTEYKIKVKVKDSDGQYSTEYYEAISTVAYNNPSITTVASTKTYNSISLTTTAAGGTNSIANYYYKVGTGAWSEAQTTNTYNITGLSENTKYTIKVKVEDTSGRFSNEYTLDVTTNTYTIPSVSATTSKTSNSITIDATGTNGDGTIAKYMYSKDGGSNWITQDSTSTSDSYTFENLTSNVKYQIRVKVVDNNDRESSEYSTSVTTDKLSFINSTANTSATYDETAKTITVDVSPTPTTIYYSTSTQLTSDNYSLYGTTTAPTRTDAGTTPVYWCAVKSGYNTYCSSNTITIEKARFSNKSVARLEKYYTGSAMSASVYVTPTPTNYYYSTTTELTESNYATAGTTTAPTRIDAGQTVTYRCAVKENYTTYCSRSVIAIKKATPTFTISSTTSTIDSSSTTSYITYTYTGDGTVSCSPTNGTYASCSVNTSTKRITFTKIAAGSQSFTISASEGTNYLEGTSQTVTVTVENQTGASYIKSLYTYQGSNGIYYHSTSLANSAGDNSYRYSGANPNNYVCFGSTASTCPADNLYRIIGIFNDQIKLIKNTNIGAYTWSGSSGVTSSLADLYWSNSTYNKNTLNGTYLNGLGYTWSSKIASTTWQVGDMTSGFNSWTAKTFYEYELGARSSYSTYTAKIGLMYVTDYGFAAYQTAWTTPLVDYSSYSNPQITQNNWMYSGGGDFTISHYKASSTNGSIFIVFDDGTIGGFPPQYQSTGRPVFFLNSDVTITSGSGTSSNPYRVS